MRILRSPSRNQLNILHSGGCLAMIGAALGVGCCLLGSVLYYGWSAGDLSLLEAILGGVLLFAFAVAGFTIASYRDCICLDPEADQVIRKTTTALVRLRRQQWAVSDFQAVELQLLERHDKQKTESFHVIRLMPSTSGPGYTLRLGSGKAGSQTLDQAKQIADFLKLPIVETSDTDAIAGEQTTPPE